MAFDSFVLQACFPSAGKVEAVAATTATEEAKARGAANTTAYADQAEVALMETFVTRFAERIAARSGRS